MEKQFAIYVITNPADTVLYTGVTNNLERRVYEHKQKLIPGFSSKYNLNKLIYFETGSDIRSAIVREKQIKSWSRAKKIALINSVNSQWKDLSIDWYS
ncbi:MAG: GIY-YIG nuclease family protein [Patescibacteria group bacterium]